MSRAPLYGGGNNSLKLDEAHDIRTRGLHPTSNSRSSSSSGHNNHANLPPSGGSVSRSKQHHSNHSGSREDWGSSDNISSSVTQDERDSDSGEVRELKSRLKMMMNKLNTTKREKETLAKENKTLQDEILVLQSNLRQMISGFSNNTSSSFPMPNELTVQIAECYKCDCLDMFFDILCAELNLKGIIYFFMTSFGQVQKLVAEYLNPPMEAIKAAGRFETLDGPIVNVLRKTYQTNHKAIISAALTKTAINGITEEIQQNLKLGGQSQETNDLIYEFIAKIGEILMLSQISDPPLYFDIKAIGTKVLFNSLKHEPFDGFIKPKEECVVVLPPVMKTTPTTASSASDAEIITKALVLQSSYEIPG